MRSAIVFGATGLVGNAVLNALLNDPEYGRVTIFVRRSTGITHEKLEEKIIDFEELENYFEFFIVNDIYWCLGSTMKRAGSKEAFRRFDFDYPLMVARDGKAYIENFIIISAIGVDPKSTFFYNQIKGELEQELKKIGLKKLIIVRPSLIIGERVEPRLWEGLAQKIIPIFNHLLPKKYRSIKAPRIAECMLKLRRGETDIEDLEFEVC